MSARSSRTRGAIGGVLVLGLVLALLLVLRADRGERRSVATAPGSGGDPPAPRAEPSVREAEPALASTPSRQQDLLDGETPAEAGSPALRGMRVLVRDAVDERPLAGARVTL